jgi:predicted DNA-binding protein (UPF0251 family)
MSKYKKIRSSEDESEIRAAIDTLKKHGILCSIDGCVSESRCNGMCFKHSTRAYRHGDPMVTKNPKWGQLSAIADKKIREIWRSMLSRCENSKHKYYKSYGGRGIKVCERWHNFSNFVSDMGDRPFSASARGYSLERKNNDGDYEPSNCKWGTQTEQARNRRTTKLTPEKIMAARSFVAEGISHAEIAKTIGVSQTTLSDALASRTWKDHV